MQDQTAGFLPKILGTLTGSGSSISGAIFGGLKDRMMAKVFGEKKDQGLAG
jgi:hypothetical protein